MAEIRRRQIQCAVIPHALCFRERERVSQSVSQWKHSLDNTEWAQRERLTALMTNEQSVGGGSVMHSDTDTLSDDDSFPNELFHRRLTSERTNQ